MEKRNFGYSLKNIPIASKNAYMKKMMEKVESVVRRMRWKAIFFENEKAGASKITYGFKTNKAPDKMELLNPFENDLYNMIWNIQFNPRRNTFQRQLACDVKEISTSKNVLVSAAKSTNLYSMSKESYKKLLNENITKNYKKSCDDTKNKIISEGKGIASKLELDDRMEIYAEREAFITLKDHKENFRSKPTCRLINPAKTEIGIVSKQLVEKINRNVRETTHLQQWKNTQAVIGWFSDLKDKSDKTFIKFDIVEFYPFISEELLERATNYAKSISAITEQQESIIWHSRKSLLWEINMD